MQTDEWLVEVEVGGAGVVPVVERLAPATGPRIEPVSFFMLSEKFALNKSLRFGLLEVVPVLEKKGLESNLEKN